MVRHFDRLSAGFAHHVVFPCRATRPRRLGACEHRVRVRGHGPRGRTHTGMIWHRNTLRGRLDSSICINYFFNSKLRKVPSIRYAPVKPLYPKKSHFCADGIETEFVTKTLGLTILVTERFVNVNEIE